MLAIVACHFNPSGYLAPKENLDKFLRSLDAHGLIEHTFLGVCLFGDQSPFIYSDKPNVSLFRSDSILWQKEALLNAVVASLPAKYTKVAILDADLILPEGWYEQTSKALDVFEIIQPWSRVTILDGEGESSACMASVGAGVCRGDTARVNKWGCYHPGYAWAMRRSFFTKGPGLYEYGILGLSDGLLALAATAGPIGMANHPQIVPLSEKARSEAMEWAGKVFEWQKGRLGSIRADITALYHGEHKDRRYMQILELLNDFDPASDLASKAKTGPLEWSESAKETKWPMIQACADYFGQRLEDKPIPEPEGDPIPNEIQWKPCTTEIDTAAPV